jgi:hypothetical protein
MAAAAVLAALSACTPTFDGKLACDSSLQCPSGYTCDLASGKCVTGSTAPEITALTPVDGVVFTGHVTLAFTAVDPEGIDSASVTLGSAAAVPATLVSGNTYKADLDTVALGQSGDVSVNATLGAKNKKGVSSTKVLSLHLDNQGPAVTSLTATPASVFSGQTLSISFDSGEALRSPPLVTLTAPGGGATLSAGFSAVTGANHYVYLVSFPRGSTAGAWAVQVKALDDRGNVTTQGGATVTLQADPAGGSVAAVTTSKTLLKLGAVATITATFPKALSAPPTAAIAGSGAALTGASGSGPYSFTLTVPGAQGTETEGPKTVAVTGTAVTGESIAGQVAVTFDFTAPQIAGVLVVESGQLRRDSNGNAVLASAQSQAVIQNGGKLHAAVVVQEAGITTTLALIPGGGGANIALSASASSTVPGLTTFDIPVTGTGALADGKYSFAAHVCDAAGNCTDSNGNNGDTIALRSAAPSLQVNGFPGVLGASKAFQFSLHSDVALALPISATLSNGPIGAKTIINLSTALDPSGGPTDYKLGGNTPAPGGGLEGSYGLAFSGTDVYGNPLPQVPANVTVDLTPPNPVITGPSVIGTVAGLPFSVSSIVNGSVEGNAGFAATGCLVPAGQPAKCTGTVLGTLTLAAQPDGKTFSGAVAVTVAQTASAQVVVVLTDAAGNTGTAVYPVQIDASTPTLQSATWSSGSITPGVPLTLALQFSKPVYGAPNFSLATMAQSGAPGTSATASSAYSLTVRFNKCDGSLGAPVSGTAFQASLSGVSDLAGNLLASSLLPSLTCYATPSLASAQWTTTRVLAPNGTGHLLLTLKGPAGGGVGITGFAGLGVNVSSAPDATATVFDLSFTMPSKCDGLGANPADGVALNFSLTFSDSAGHTSPVYASSATGSPFAPVTCSATRVGAVDPTKVQLSLFPMGDGQVRSIVMAQSGWITPTGGNATAGVTLVARDASGNLLGSGPLLSNGSVGPFTLSSTITQAKLSVVDAVGNVTAINGYPESVELSFTGKSQSGSQNPIQAFDASSGGFGVYPPAVWPLAGRELTSSSYAALENFDQNVATSQTAPQISVTSTTMGYSPSTPIASVISGRGAAATAIAYGYAGVSGGQPQYANFDYVYGGCNGTVAADLDPSTIWRFGIASNAQTGPFSGTSSKVTLSGTAVPNLGPSGPATVTDGTFLWVMGGQACSANSAAAGSTGIWRLTLPNTPTAPATAPTPAVWTDTGDSLATHTLINSFTGWGSTGAYSYCPSGASFCGPAVLAYNPASTAACTIYLPTMATPAARFIDCGSTLPPARLNAQIGFDPSTNAWYLYGGASGATIYNDLWKATYSASTGKVAWSAVTTTNTTGRESGYLFWDTDASRLTLLAPTSAGKGDLSQSEIWQLNATVGSTCGASAAPCWQQIADTTAGIMLPPTRFSATRENAGHGYTASFASSGSYGVLFGGNNGAADLGDAWVTGNYSQPRMLIKMPAGITNLAGAQGLSASLNLVGTDGNQVVQIWNGTGWEFAGSPRYAGSGPYALFTSLANPYVQADGNVYLLLVGQNWGYVQGPGGNVFVDYFKMQLNFK